LPTPYILLGVVGLYFLRTERCQRVEVAVRHFASELCDVALWQRSGSAKAARHCLRHAKFCHRHSA
jgi:hypothetical protein